MYVNGAFVRSESGRYFRARHRDRTTTPIPPTVNVPRGSRKDARDAVLAAVNAKSGWAGRTAFNRGQIWYRLAECASKARLDGARVGRSSAAAPTPTRPRAKSTRPSIAPYFTRDSLTRFLRSSRRTIPFPDRTSDFLPALPMGVVGVHSRAGKPALLGLVSPLRFSARHGRQHASVAVASEIDPRTAILFSECLATSDLPNGVINVLTGHPFELAPVLAKHREVCADRKRGSPIPELSATQVERLGADNVKRSKTHRACIGRALARRARGTEHRLDRALPL